MLSVLYLNKTFNSRLGINSSSFKVGKTLLADQKMDKQMEAHIVQLAGGVMKKVVYVMCVAKYWLKNIR